MATMSNLSVYACYVVDPCGYVVPVHSYTNGVQSECEREADQSEKRRCCASSFACAFFGSGGACGGMGDEYLFDGHH